MSRLGRVLAALPERGAWLMVLAGSRDGAAAAGRPAEAALWALLAAELADVDVVERRDLEALDFVPGVEIREAGWEK